MLWPRRAETKINTVKQEPSSSAARSVRRTHNNWHTRPPDNVNNRNASRLIRQTGDDLNREFSLAWTDVTAVELYTVQDVPPLLETEILPGLASGGYHGLRWHSARPPVTEVEMGAQAISQELVLPGVSFISPVRPTPHARCVVLLPVSRLAR